MRIGIAVRILVSIGLLGWLATRLDYRELGFLFSSAYYGAFAAAILAGCGFVVLLAFRLDLLLRASEVNVPFRPVWRTTWGSQFFNLFLPGSTGGDLFKVVELCRLVSASKSRLIGIVVADRAFALIALIMLAAVGLFLDRAAWNKWMPQDARVQRWTLLLGCIVAVCAGMFWLLAGKVPKLGNIRRSIIAVIFQASGYFRGRAVTWIQLGMAILVHLVNFAGVYCVARALGLQLTYVQVLSLMPVLMLILLLPITVNGHGLREVVLIAYFRHGGIVGPADAPLRELAIAFSFGLVAYDLAAAIPGGLWWMVHSRQSHSDSVCRKPID